MAYDNVRTHKKSGFHSFSKNHIFGKTTRCDQIGLSFFRVKLPQGLYGRDTYSTKLCNSSTATPMFCYIFQVMKFGTNSENRKSGCDCELQDNDVIFIWRKRSEM